MKSLAIACVIACALPLAACNPPGAPSAAIPATPPNSHSIAAVAGGNLAKACSIIATAEGYFNAVSFLVPARYVVAESAAAAAADEICSTTGQAGVGSALARLDKLWAQIQALTTVPKT